MKSVIGRFKAVAVAAASSAALGLAAQAAAAELDNPHDSTCRVVRGMLVPDCNAAICTQGTLTGDLAGRFSSRVTSIYPAGSGWTYTGWTRVELAGGAGRFETLNRGTTPFDEQRGPDLARATELLTVAETGGSLEATVGTLVLSGAFALGRPTEYVGRLCRPLAAR